MITERALRRDEIEDAWTIDRSEVIDAAYRLENGTLVLGPEHDDVRGWPPGEAEKYTPILRDCFDRGGWFHGVFDDRRLIGLAVLESRFIGKNRDQLQLTFFHVSQSHRGQGWGRRLFERARSEARRRGATAMYISATPSEHTIDFYLSFGCIVALEPDPQLLELEPDDIHLECPLAPDSVSPARG